MDLDSRLRGHENRGLLQRTKGSSFSSFARTASRELDQLDAATGLRDLARPGNRLERLMGDRKGQWGMGINDKWRICFVWVNGSPGPAKVQIVDYH